MNDEKTPPPSDKTMPVYQSQTLFQGGKVVLIVHEGREYWLRITQAGKLILTA
ncbi:MAG: hemin uptake protein HemP [Pseudomonadota bacterium]|jgi:hemin uptake protein HemP